MTTYSYNPNYFKGYELSEDELVAGYILTNSNLAVIKNLLVEKAHEMLNVKYSDELPHKAAIDAAYTKGAMDILAHILDANLALSEPKEGQES